MTSKIKNYKNQKPLNKDPIMDIPKQYEPQAAQDKWYPVWEERGYFNADPHPDKKPHTIMIPLPNVTGALHMGHALNGTLQDLITRWRRMQGYEALWMPGTDHAGIATQAVVERRMLEEEGLTRHDVGREALVNRIWKWKDAYERRILGQLKQLGASCDWRRTRFTLDEVCSKAVRRTFFKFFKDGLIYRGKRLVNWDTYLQTAVADDEVFDEEVDGHFWTFTYPVVDDAGNDTGQKIAFSTTRPETMLGDTAVCVHPSDDRYRNLVGQQVRIPLNGRMIPIIADGQLANPEMGTGAVKVTPAHDPNDYACFQRHPEIGLINILNPNGTMNENGNPYEGQDRYQCRENVIEKMEILGHFVEVADRKIPIKHSDRSKTPIEPYMSDQWFVKMEDLAQNAIDAVSDGRVKFFPSRFTKTYQDWLGEKRDWCISRQLWWGHRIPIWYCSTCSEEELQAAFGDRKDINWRKSDDRDDWLICSETDLEPDALGPNHILTQDPDVLDTWFSSALWPHETLGWPDTDRNPPLGEREEPANGRNQGADAPRSPGKNEVLPYFYPGNVLVTARDIITLWVARMVLTGLYNMGDIPFSHVCVHPNLQDGFGQKMSKSKGNGVDPADLIDKYGTDAVRFTIASFAGETQDVRLPISYECPHCEEFIDPKLYKINNATVVVPATMKGDFPVPAGQPKPMLVCTKCKKESQFSTPLYDAESSQPIARVVSERFEYGQKFCNKLWNACRFALMNLEGYSPAPIEESDLRMEDRWILSRLSTVSEELTTLLSRYQFDAATRALRDFTWNEFCDWYLEMIKPRLRDEGQGTRDKSQEPKDGDTAASDSSLDSEPRPLTSGDRPAAQRVLVGVMDNLLRMLQPFTPFITEDLWQRLNEIAPERGLLQPEAAAESVMLAAWPELPQGWQDKSLEARFERLQDTIVAVRNVRAHYNIGPSTPLTLHVRCPENVAADMNEVSDQFDNLAKTVLQAAGAEVERPPVSASFALADADGFIPLEGAMDVDAERERLEKKLKEVQGYAQGNEKKLANENFVNKAPEHVVNDVRETLSNLKSQAESIQEMLRQLKRD